MKPSIKTLEAAFPGQGKQLRRILDADAATALTLTHVYPKVAEWYRMCYSKPKTLDLQFQLLDAELEGYGDEAIFKPGSHQPDAEYINLGDTYNTTLLYDHLAQRWMVTTYGDWIERQERKGRVYA